MTKVDFDDEEIQGFSSIIINEPVGDFSPEWESYNFMENIKKAVSSLANSLEEAKATEHNYTSVADKISSDPHIEMLEIPDELEISNTSIGTGMVTATSLKVRAGKGTDKKVLTYVSKDDKVEILEKDDNGWTKVRLSDGTIGYVGSKYLDTDEIDQTPTLESEPKDIKTNKKAKVITKNQGLNVRIGPGKEYDIKTSAKKGSTVEIITPANSEGWAEVKLSDGTTGFVKVDYLEEL